MAASSTKPASPAASVQALLLSERDAHRRQRELVRASLMLCPAKTDPHAVPAQR